MTEIDDSKDLLAARQKNIRVDILALAQQIGRAIRPSEVERWSARYGCSYKQAMDLLDMIEDRLNDWARELGE